MKNRIICIKYITHCWCTVLSCNPILLVSRLHIMYGGMGVTQRKGGHDLRAAKNNFSEHYFQTITIHY